MKTKYAMLFLFAIMTLIVSNLTSAYVIRNVTAERQAEWDRYEQYRADYLQSNDLEAFSKYISERNLQNEFGFKPASYYYVPPSVLQAAYNPPLQGVSYYTDNRGYTSSLNQPSAVQYYGDVVNGHYTGNIPSKIGSTYFDHPQINGGKSYLTNSYQASTYTYSSNYYSTNYPSAYSYDYNNYNSYGYDEPTYAGTYLSGDNYGVYGNSGYGDYYSGSEYDYAYGNYQSLGAYDTNSGEPAYYARIVEPTTGGFYVIGYY
jgi:hypothetical protein